MTYTTLDNSPVAGLKPGLFWKHFYELTRIPRPSGSEKAVGDYLVECAKKMNLEGKRDDAGNVLIRKQATKGHEKAPGVILQSHLDMVCEKNSSVSFDFHKDPIRIKREGDFITADGTSLGADNAAGIAASLAVLEEEGLVHPPLECLFTIDEETGMTGAKNLKGDFLQGRRLLNLDSEQMGDIYVGCAGGSDNVLRLPLIMVPAEAGSTFVEVKVTGLKGGHSGLDIHEGRANAIRLLGRFLSNCHSDGLEFHLVSFKGGSKRNAIPREAEALIALKPQALTALKEKAASWEKIYRTEYSPVEEIVEISIKEGKAHDRVFLPDCTIKALDLLILIPHGVLAMSRSLKDLVESSTNLAIVKTENQELSIELSHRSSSGTFIRSIDERTEALARLCRLKYSRGQGYPGWQPDMESEVLRIARETYRKSFDKEAEIKAIHAGLECGLIIEKFPGMDAISFGPTLRNVHSPDEVINIPSVEVFWKYLVELLKALS
ncbi:MAG: aminoacyl-histidine dipeptidase [Candidatus Eremiobacteraeota bacterium]|nr:aminoacyl-histidine dipeptidase [Candidatus Eremiobacteraeota bacterium]